MISGVLKEIKIGQSRVAMTPDGVEVMKNHGHTEMAQGGDGVLLGDVPGVDPGSIAILGGGTVGINAAKRAAGLGPECISSMSTWIVCVI